MGGEGQIVNACLKFSYLWKYIKVFNLRENMRVKLSKSQFLLSVGDGSIGDLVRLPDEMMLKTNKIEELVEFVCPSFEQNHHNLTWLSERAILCPTNREADEINNWMTDTFQDQEFIYKSCDSTDDFNQEFQSEFLNTLNLPGMPPHKLVLKMGMPVMLFWIRKMGIAIELNM